MLIKTKAIVLRKVKYGEGQIIADTLTEEMGRVSFICRIPASPRGQMKRQYFLPLTILDIEMDYRHNRQLQHLRNISLRCPLASLSESQQKNAVTLFAAEFLNAATKGERQPDAALYNYIESNIRWLNDASGRYANFHLVMMMRLTRFLGFAPNLNTDDGNCFFDLRSGCFTGMQPSHGDFLKPSEAALVNSITRMDLANMRLFHFTREERNRCCDIILQYYKLHLPDFNDLNSLSIIRELLG